MADATKKPDAIVAKFDANSPVKKADIKYVLGRGKVYQNYLDKDLKVLPGEWRVKEQKWVAIESVDGATQCVGCHATNFDPDSQDLDRARSRLRGLPRPRRRPRGQHGRRRTSTASRSSTRSTKTWSAGSATRSEPTPPANTHSRPHSCRATISTSTSSSPKSGKASRNSQYNYLHHLQALRGRHVLHKLP